MPFRADFWIFHVIQKPNWPSTNGYHTLPTQHKRDMRPFSIA
jgi:hypothetical protein